MEKPSSYCAFVATLDDNDLHKIYHDTQYGFPIEDDNELFGRLILEINQAGLSWTTILKKQHTFRLAYDNFEIKKIAEYTQSDINRLLMDEGIIRNRLKINASIYNAQAMLKIQQEHTSFKNWLDSQPKMELKDWVKLFKKHFKFVGGEITNEFLMSTGYLPGSHIQDCPIYDKINH